jgi:excisionase family DNA binding protein
MHLIAGSDAPRAASTLLTPTEVATLLRTSKKAIYAMTERGQLPGTTRIGRRLLFRQDALLDWLGQKSTPSLESRER